METTNQTVEQVPTPPSNPLLQRLQLPGQTYRLPSGGLFYKNGELSPDTTNGEVHVHPMTTFDEILMKSPDLLFSGQAIEQVFKRCIPQVVKPMQLFSKDVDFLLTCLRMVTFGESVDITYKHDCKDAKEHTYAVPLQPFVENAKRIDPTRAVDLGKFEARNKQLLVFRPPRMKDVIELFQAPSKELTPEQLNDTLVASILAVIESVDGITDKAMIRQWLEQIPAGWMQDISGAIEAVGDWGPNFETKIKCKDCGAEVTLASPINPVAFFM